MRALPMILLMACSPSTIPPVDDLSASWDDVVGGDVAPAVWYVSQNAAGDEVGFVDEAELCTDAALLGGRGPLVACLGDEPGPVAALTRNEVGDTVRVDGPEAVCPEGWALVGQQGEAAVCVGDAPGVVSVLSDSEVVGTPMPDCPVGWQALGAQDFNRVCTRTGLGAVIQLSRTPAGETVSNVPPEQICPLGSAFIGRQRRTVLCDYPDPATVIRVSRGLSDPVNPVTPTCPQGWRVQGGLDRASVCLLDTSVLTVSVSRVPDSDGSLRTGQGECPEGAERLGWDGGASVCGFR